MVLINKVNANSIEWFFLAPIWLYNNKIYFLAMSAMSFIITFFKILLRVFFKAIK